LKIGEIYGSHFARSALRVEPSLMNELSDLYIDDLVLTAPGDTRNEVFYPSDVFVIHFNEVSVQDNPLFTNWVPIPSEIDVCDFGDLAVSCEKVSNYALKLTLEDYTQVIRGHVGKI
jgi:hypothetical protein